MALHAGPIYARRDRLAQTAAVVYLMTRGTSYNDNILPMNASPMPVSIDAAPSRPEAGNRPSPNRREPNRRDYLAYLLLLPFVIAAWMTALGIGPKADISRWQSFFYVGTRVLVAWWCAHLGALAAARLLRGRSVPLWVILLAGFLLIWLPVTVLFNFHLQLLDLWFPGLSGRIVHPEFSLSVEYFTYFITRTAGSFLPVWMAVVHAYRKQFGVDWYSPRQPEDPRTAAPISESRSCDAPGAAPFPSFMALSRLPPDARLHTLKAAEHYIEVVADKGKELVRWRFNDAVRELSALNIGCQVHRSWWVSWDGIREIVPCGRTIELVIRDGRRIPVSLTYKNGFLSQYRRI